MKARRSHHVIIVLSLEIMSLLASPTPIPAYHIPHDVETSAQAVEGTAKLDSPVSSMDRVNSMSKIDGEIPQTTHQWTEELPTHNRFVEEPTSSKQSVEKLPELKKPRQWPLSYQKGWVNKFVSASESRVKILDAKASKGDVSKWKTLWNYLKLKFFDIILAGSIKFGRSNYAMEELRNSAAVRELILREPQRFRKLAFQLDLVDPRSLDAKFLFEESTPAQLSRKLTRSSKKITELVADLNREKEYQGLFKLAKKIRKSSGDKKEKLVNRFNGWVYDLNLDLHKKGLTIQFHQDEGKDTWHIAEVPVDPLLKTPFDKPSPLSEDSDLKNYREGQVKAYKADIRKIVKDGEELKFHDLHGPSGDVRPRPTLEDRLEESTIVNFQRSTKPLEKLIEATYLHQAEYAAYYVTYLRKTPALSPMSDAHTKMVEEIVNKWLHEPETIVRTLWQDSPKEEALGNIVRNHQPFESTETTPADRQLLTRDRLAAENAKDSLTELENKVWHLTRHYRDH